MLSSSRWIDSRWNDLAGVPAATQEIRGPAERNGGRCYWFRAAPPPFKRTDRDPDRRPFAGAVCAKSVRPQLNRPATQERSWSVAGVWGRAAERHSSPAVADGETLDPETPAAINALRLIRRWLPNPAGQASAAGLRTRNRDTAA